MKKKIPFVIAIAISLILIIINSLIIFKQLFYKNNYELTNGSIIEITTKDGTNKYMQYTINSQIFNIKVENAAKDNKVEIYYKKEDPYNIRYKKNVITEIITNIISTATIIICIIKLIKLRKKRIIFYKFKG